jgi:hypothetical protein
MAAFRRAQVGQCDRRVVNGNRWRCGCSRDRRVAVADDQAVVAGHEADRNQGAHAEYREQQRQQQRVLGPPHCRPVLHVLSIT